MPKLMNYSKGSILYFENDKSTNILIMQNGIAEMTERDVESGLVVKTHIKSGEFIGIKSAFCSTPREETVTALVDCKVISMTVAEFEALLCANKPLLTKMLRVFSNQLRQIHNKISVLLKQEPNDKVNIEQGMINVARSFFNEKKFKSSLDVCTKFAKCYPNSEKLKEIKGIIASCTKNLSLKTDESPDDSTFEMPSNVGTLALFKSDMFKRFEKIYEKNSVIISEYEPGDSFYIILHGSVQLTKLINGVNKNLDILRPGEFFGEMAILDNSPRSATCIAKGKVEVLEFNKDNFPMLITGNPKIAILLLKLFCKRVYDQKQRLKILVVNDNGARIAGVFVMLCEMSGNKKLEYNNPDAATSITFNTSVADIARWAGLSEEDTKDELARYSRIGKLVLDEGKINVLNIEYMKRTFDAHVKVYGNKS